MLHSLLLFLLPPATVFLVWLNMQYWIRTKDRYWPISLLVWILHGLSGALVYCTFKCLYQALP